MPRVFYVQCSNYTVAWLAWGMGLGNWLEILHQDHRPSSRNVGFCDFSECVATIEDYTYTEGIPNGTLLIHMTTVLESAGSM